MAEEELIEITIPRKKRILEGFPPPQKVNPVVDLQAAMDAFQAKKAKQTYEETSDYLFQEWQRLAGLD